MAKIRNQISRIIPLGIWIFLITISLCFGSLSRVTTWVDDQILTHTDLNAEFDNILDNAASLLSGLTLIGNLDFDGYEATDAVLGGRTRYGSASSFTDGDTTPSVATNNFFKTASTSACVTT